MGLKIKYYKLIMTKVEKKQLKAPKRMRKNIVKRAVKSKLLRKLQKSRPKRYMNPFLCFAHEVRKNAKGIHSGTSLLSDWKAAHKGLGAKWRALGAGKAKFHKHGKVPAFAMFVKESAQRKQVLPLWRTAHKGLGGKWKGMDKAAKAKYIALSKQMKSPYDQQMKSYKKKRQELVKSIRNTSKAKRAAKKLRKLQSVQVKRAKVARHKAKKTLRRKGASLSKKAKKAKLSLKKKGKKSISRKQKKSRKSKANKKGVARKINARIRVTRISSRTISN